MTASNKTAAELKRACEAAALLKVWRRHRTSDDDSLAAFAEWTLDHPEIVAAEMAAEVAQITASLPDGTDQEKLNQLRAR